MNKVILLAVVCISFGSTSCKKERTCECTNTTNTTTTFSGGGSSSSSSVSTSKSTAEKQTKKFFRVNERCYSTSSTRTETGIGYTEVSSYTSECTLK